LLALTEESLAHQDFSPTQKAATPLMLLVTASPV
jgi:hypothetical protein